MNPVEEATSSPRQAVTPGGRPSRPGPPAPAPPSSPATQPVAASVAAVTVWCRRSTQTRCHGRPRTARRRAGWRPAIHSGPERYFPSIVRTSAALRTAHGGTAVAWLAEGRSGLAREIPPGSDRQGRQDRVRVSVQAATRPRQVHGRSGRGLAASASRVNPLPAGVLTPGAGKPKAVEDASEVRAHRCRHQEPGHRTDRGALSGSGPDLPRRRSVPLVAAPTREPVNSPPEGAGRHVIEGGLSRRGGILGDGEWGSVIGRVQGRHLHMGRPVSRGHWFRRREGRNRRVGCPPCS